MEHRKHAGELRECVGEHAERLEDDREHFEIDGECVGDVLDLVAIVVLPVPPALPILPVLPVPFLAADGAQLAAPAQCP